MKIVDDDLILQIVKTQNVNIIQRQITSWLHQPTTYGAIIIRHVRFITCNVKDNKLTNFEQTWIQQSPLETKRTQITQATVEWSLERPLLVWKQYKNWNDEVLSQLFMNFTHTFWSRELD